MRMVPFYLCFVATAAFGVLTALGYQVYLVPFLVCFALAAMGTWDMIQAHHSILRLYPVIGHFRWLFEEIRPEIRQYLFESSTDGTPFNRDQRSLVYQRAKGVSDKRPFGTELNV